MNGITNMKTIIVLACLLIATITAAQGIYKVTPGAKDNQIDLTVANTSPETALRDIKIDIIQKPVTCTFANESKTIKRINNNDSTLATFTFDIARVVDVTKTDTIKFVIKDNSGSSWEKQILIGYEMPQEFRLEQNYPNPFNPTTTIEFTIPGNVETLQEASLRIYNILGQEVATLINKPLSPGYYKIEWNAGSYASGMYIYRLNGKDVNIVKKMMVLK
jgi:hypothetical protein